MVSEVLNSFNNFEQNLYQKCAVGQTENVIVSSFSILMALTMALMGSRGRTEEIMRTALGYQNLQSDKILTSIKNISHLMENDDTVKIANKIYISSKYNLNQMYNENVVTYFNSETERMDYNNPMDAANKINNWIELKTNNKIKEMISIDSLRDQPPLLIINAVYFKARWLHMFDKELTQSMDFFVSNGISKKTDFMKHKKLHRYVYDRNLNSQILMMDYYASDMSMVIILPEDYNGLDTLESKLSNIKLNEILKTINYQQVAVTMPKFKIEFSVDLKEPLTQMGLESIFGDSADFTGMLEGNGALKVGKIIHKAFIDVNEEYAEATGSIQMHMILNSPRIITPPTIFTADHPFVFYLWNKKLGTSVFSGKYISP